MTIYPNTAAPFNCAICKKQKPKKWEHPNHKDRPPICCICETNYGVGPIYDPNPDRRTIKQISALICVIEIDAYRISTGKEPIYG